MRTTIRMFLIVAGVATMIPGLLSAGSMLDDLRSSFSVGPNQRTAASLPASSDAYQQALVDGYRRMASEQYNEGNYASADLYYRKAIQAAGGQAVGPEDPASFPDLLDADRAQAQSLLSQVTQWVQANRQRDPSTAARLQLQYDCWVEEMSEQEYGDADKCKPAIPATVAQTPAAAPIAPAANCSSNPDGLSETGSPCRTASVAFAFDRYDLLNRAEDGDRADTVASQEAALDLFIRQARTIKPARLDLIGRADTVGPEDYNYGLSLCRARSVEGELRKRGLPADIAVQLIPLGKTKPIVKTADGIREPANRVVTVAYLKDRNAPPAEAPAAAPAHDLFGCGTPKHPFPPVAQRVASAGGSMPQQQAQAMPAKTGKAKAKKAKAKM